MKVAVIGSGPAGLCSAITSARCADEVVVFEKNSTSGKKLLLTGNGRCNIGNVNQDIKYYHSSNSNILKQIINEDSFNDVKNFLDSIGVVCKDINNYLYPMSLKSSSIKSALMTEARVLGVKFIYNECIKELEFKNNKCIINNQVFDKVILATGSKVLNDTSFGYDILKNTNHFLVNTYPSLVPLVSNIKITSLWKNLRTHALVSLYIDNKFIKSEEGELQLTKYGVSGICILNLSRYVAPALDNKKEVIVHIDFLPSINNIKEYIENRNNLLKLRNITELLDMFIDYNILYALFKYIDINPNKNYNSLSNEEKSKLFKTLKDFEVPITDTLGFENAQVSSGGLSLDEIDASTMRSKKIPSLFVAGEILDIDGDCGGYNLTMCFITALKAGYHD